MAAPVFEPVTPASTIKRDRWGRYVIPDPDTGKERSWTRATTLAGTLADRFDLEQWSKRNVVLGIGARADLYAQAASCTPEDKDTLNAIVAQAEEASKSHAGANLGTALHRFTERLDAGEDISPPAPWDADVAAYREAMAAHGVAVLPEWIERVLLVPELGVAGTCDRLCNAMEWALPRIGDLKTGKDVLRYSMPEIAIQLSLYAHATHWFDPAAGVLHEIDLKIDRQRAVVMHLPVGQATCSLYEVDIEAGWAMAGTAVEVRDWRKRKDLAGQLAPSATPSVEMVTTEVVPELPTANVASTVTTKVLVQTPKPEEPSTNGDLHAARLEWLRARILKIIEHSPEAAQALAREWSTHDHIPTMKAGGPRDAAEIETVVASCWAVEKTFGLPFPDEEPGVDAFIDEAERQGLIDPQNQPNTKE